METIGHFPPGQRPTSQKSQKSKNITFTLRRTKRTQKRNQQQCSLPPQMRYYGKVMRWAGLIINGSRLPNVKPWLKRRRIKRARQRHDHEVNILVPLEQWIWRSFRLLVVPFLLFILQTFPPKISFHQKHSFHRK